MLTANFTECDFKYMTQVCVLLYVRFSSRQRLGSICARLSLQARYGPQHVTPICRYLQSTHNSSVESKGDVVTECLSPGESEFHRPLVEYLRRLYPMNQEARFLLNKGRTSTFSSFFVFVA